MWTLLPVLGSYSCSYTLEVEVAKVLYADVAMHVSPQLPRRLAAGEPTQPTQPTQSALIGHENIQVTE